MAYTEADIAHENGDHWVLRVRSGRAAGTFEVYRAGATHSTRCAIIGYRGDEGLRRAIAECDRRAGGVLAS